jgi:hypothetical protein
MTVPIKLIGYIGVMRSGKGKQTLCVLWLGRGRERNPGVTRSFNAAGASRDQKDPSSHLCV